MELMRVSDRNLYNKGKKDIEVNGYCPEYNLDSNSEVVNM